MSKKTMQKMEVSRDVHYLYTHTGQIHHIFLPQMKNQKRMSARCVVAATPWTHRRDRRAGLDVMVLGALVGSTTGVWATGVSPAPKHTSCAMHTSPPSHEHFKSGIYRHLNHLPHSWSYSQPLSGIYLTSASFRACFSTIR